MDRVHVNSQTVVFIEVTGVMTKCREMALYSALLMSSLKQNLIKDASEMVR